MGSAYGCRPGFEKEGGLCQPCLGGGEVGHRSCGGWPVLLQFRYGGYKGLLLCHHNVRVKLDSRSKEFEEG